MMNYGRCQVMVNLMLFTSSADKNTISDEEDQDEEEGEITEIETDGEGLKLNKFPSGSLNLFTLLQLSYHRPPPLLVEVLLAKWLWGRFRLTYILNTRYLISSFDFNSLITFCFQSRRWSGHFI